MNRGRLATSPIDSALVPNRAGRFCKCGACGLVAKCAWGCDFYDLPNVPAAWLLCEVCICDPRAVARRRIAHGIEPDASDLRALAVTGEMS